MTNNRLNALERETADSELRATKGTSPAAGGAGNKESATAIAVTLSKLTAADVVHIAAAANLSPSDLFQCFIEYLPTIEIQGPTDSCK